MRGLTARCGRCNARLERDASFCPACGAPSGRLEVEVEGGLGATDGHEVVFERPRRRGRLVVGGLVGAVGIAVVANLLVGGRNPTRSTSPTTVPGSRTTADATSTTVAQPVTLARGPLLGEPTGLTLVVVSTKDTYRLELDTALLSVVPGSVPYDDVAPVHGGFVGWSQGNLSVVPWDGGPTRRLADGGQLVGEGPAGTQWFYDYGSVSGQLRTIDGVEAAPEAVNLDLESLRFGTPVADGLGGVVGQLPGGVFRWFPGGASVAVAPGELMDAQHGYVLTRQCFPGPGCTATVTDLRTGAATPVVPFEGLAVRQARVSPDGRWLVLGPTLSDGRSAPGPPFTLHRVGDGAEVTFPTDYTALNSSGLNQRSGVVWSSDGRWLFTVTGANTISAWREGLAKPIAIALPDAYLQGPLAVELPA